MKLITGITSDYKQRAMVQIEDGTTVYLNLVYMPQQTGWFVDLLWESKQINGLRLTTSPNLLYKWKNILPFGLMLLVNDDSEPLNLEDFSNGSAQLYLLGADDLTEVNAFAFNPDYSSG